jgi:hypothetical protein
MGPYIVVVGTVLEGFKFYGPFATHDAAMDFAVLFNHGATHWCVSPLLSGDGNAQENKI